MSPAALPDAFGSMISEDFAQIVGMSAAASIAIVVILVVRLLLKRAPRVFSYALWGIVLIRLLLPLSVTSEFSIVPAPLIEEAIVSTTLTQSSITDESNSSDLPTASETIGSLPQDGAPVAGSPTSLPSEENPTSNSSVAVAPDVASLLPIAWAAGIAVMAIYAVISSIRLHRRLAGSRQVHDNIYLADGIDSPFVLGIVHPRIYLPSFLERGERFYVVKHEQHHIRRLDHITRALAFVALCLHWFNPLVWVAFFLSKKDMEMSCDEAVVESLGSESRADYSTVLLNLATGKRFSIGSPLAFGENSTRERIRNMARWKAPAAWVVAVAFALCAVTACTTLTDAKDDEANPPDVQLPVDQQPDGDVQQSTEDADQQLAGSDGDQKLAGSGGDTNGGELGADSSVSKDNEFEDLVVVTPFYTITIPEEYAEGAKWAYHLKEGSSSPDSALQSMNQLSISLEGEAPLEAFYVVATTKVDNSTNDMTTPRYVMTRAGDVVLDDTTWTVVVYTAYYPNDPNDSADKARAAASEYVSWIKVGFDPSSVTDKTIMAEFLKSQAGKDWAGQQGFDPSAMEPTATENLLAKAEPGAKDMTITTPLYSITVPKEFAGNLSWTYRGQEMAYAKHEWKDDKVWDGHILNVSLGKDLGFQVVAQRADNSGEFGFYSSGKVRKAAGQTTAGGHLWEVAVFSSFFKGEESSYQAMVDECVKWVHVGFDPVKTTDERIFLSFLGSHLGNAWANDGNDVYVLDRLNGILESGQWISTSESLDGNLLKASSFERFERTSLERNDDFTERYDCGVAMTVSLSEDGGTTWKEQSATMYPTQVIFKLPDGASKPTPQMSGIIWGMGTIALELDNHPERYYLEL